MYYSDTNSRAGELLRLVLGLITRHNLPADPLSYTVLYDYAAGRNTSLTEEIDAALSDSRTITRDHISDFYLKHILEKDRLISEKILAELKGIMTEISRFVVETQGDISGHGSKLESLAEELAVATDMDSISKTVDQLIQTARSLGKSGATLQGHMTSSSEDLEILRDKLEKSKQEAITDSLTGIANRRGFQRHLRRQVAAFKKTGKPFCVVLIDLDHFKEINDTFGHLVGDSILKALAQILKQAAGETAIPARYGGDEFVLLLPGESLESALITAETVRTTLASREWKQKGSGSSIGKLTLSMGVALYREGESEESLLQRADTALYAAKHNGRNQVAAEQKPGQATRA